MGQKDQDGYYAEECHFFQLRSLNSPILKQVQTKVKKSTGFFCLYKSLFVNKIVLCTLGGPPGGQERGGPNQ